MKQKVLIQVVFQHYMGEYKKKLIEGIKYTQNLALSKNDFVFHAGTKKVNNELLSSGGRVLNFVTTSSSFKNSRERIVSLINQLNWENGFFRKDIGFKIIDK